MKILHAVEFYAPSLGGSQEVVRRISEAMAARGHDVTVATTALADRSFSSLNGVRIVEFAISGSAVRGVVGNSWEYQSFLAESDFDVIMTYAAQQWTTDLLLDAADSISGVKVCAPCGFSRLRDPQYEAYFESLPEKLARLDGTIYHSPTYQDIAYARDHGLGGLHVIPNGAAETEFGHLDPDAISSFRERHGIQGRMILTVGSHTGLKGHRQAMAAFAFTPVGPSTLVVVGNGLPGSGCRDSCMRWGRRLDAALRPLGRRVRVLDLPREEVVVALGAADLFLLLSVVECSPLVLFEACAAGTPFLSADVGNAREIAEWTGGGVVVPAMVEFGGGFRLAKPLIMARQLRRMLANGPELGAMGRKARGAWQAHFRWESLADQYLNVYQELLEARASVVPGTVEP